MKCRWVWLCKLYLFLDCFDLVLMALKIVEIQCKYKSKARIQNVFTDECSELETVHRNNVFCVVFRGIRANHFSQHHSYSGRS